MAENYTTISETKKGLTQLKTYTDTELGKKQDILTAGSGIDITNNVISSTSTGGDFYVNGTIAEEDIDRSSQSEITADKITLDKTLEEIYAAATAGKNVILSVKIGDAPEKYQFRPVMLIDDGSVKGFSTSCVSSSAGGVFSLHTIVKTDDGWEWYVSIQVASNYDLTTYINTLIGDILTLKTKAKDNIVAAINELADENAKYQEIPLKMTGTNGEVVDVRVLGRVFSIFTLDAGLYNNSFELVKALNVSVVDYTTSASDLTAQNTIYLSERPDTHAMHVRRVNADYPSGDVILVLPSIATRVEAYTLMDCDITQRIKGVILPDSIESIADYAPMGYGSRQYSVYIDNNDYITDIWYRGSADTTKLMETCPNATLHTS